MLPIISLAAKAVGMYLLKSKSLKDVKPSTYIWVIIVLVLGFFVFRTYTLSQQVSVLNNDKIQLEKDVQTLKDSNENKDKEKIRNDNTCNNKIEIMNSNAKSRLDNYKKTQEFKKMNPLPDTNISNGGTSLKNINNVDIGDAQEKSKISDGGNLLNEQNFTVEEIKSQQRYLAIMAAYRDTLTLQE